MNLETATTEELFDHLQKELNLLELWTERYKNCRIESTDSKSGYLKIQMPEEDAIVTVNKYRKHIMKVYMDISEEIRRVSNELKTRE